VCHNSTDNLAAEINTGSSGYDLFLAADSTSIALKVAEGQKEDGTEFIYTEGVPVLWTKTAGVNISGGNVTNDTVTSLAVADPVKAPYGVAAEEILTETDQLEAVKPKIGTYFDNIALTKDAIASGDKSAGFIAKSQICNNGVAEPTFYEYPDGYYTKVLQQVGVLKPNANAALTANFVTYLLGAEAQGTLTGKFCYKPRPQ